MQLKEKMDMSFVPRLVGDNETPSVSAVRYREMDQEVLAAWLDSLKEGRDLAGSYCWRFPYDIKRTTATAVGHLLLAQTRLHYSKFKGISYSVAPSGNLAPSYLGIQADEELEIPDVEDKIAALATYANKDLHALSLRYVLPVVDTAAVAVNEQ
jgi:hypothetical protein